MAITDMQGRLQGKRLDAGAFVREIAEHGAEGCHYLLAVDIDMNTLPGFRMSGWDSGYGDFVFRPDLATLRRCTWLEGTVMVQADMEWHDGTPVAQAPRSILKAQLARLAERGWTAKIGSELEFILFRETLRGEPRARATATSRPPTSTTSTTRSSARPSSRT